MQLLIQMFQEKLSYIEKIAEQEHFQDFNSIAESNGLSGFEKIKKIYLTLSVK